MDDLIEQEGKTIKKLDDFAQRLYSAIIERHREKNIAWPTAVISFPDTHIRKVNSKTQILAWYLGSHSKGQADLN